MADHHDDAPDPTPEADDLKDAHLEEAQGDGTEIGDTPASLAGDDPPLDPDPH